MSIPFPSYVLAWWIAQYLCCNSCSIVAQGSLLPLSLPLLKHCSVDNSILHLSLSLSLGMLPCSEMLYLLNLFSSLLTSRLMFFFVQCLLSSLVFTVLNDVTYFVFGQYSTFLLCLPGTLLLLSVEGGVYVLLSTEPATVLVRRKCPHAQCLQYLLRLLLRLVAIGLWSCVCGVLGLTWVVFLLGVCPFSHHCQKLFKDLCVLLPWIPSFCFKKGVHIVADVALHEVWFRACFFDKSQFDA